MTISLSAIPMSKTEEEMEIDRQVQMRTMDRKSILFERNVVQHLGLLPASEIAKLQDSDEEEEDGNFDNLAELSKEQLLEKLEALKTIVQEKDVICDQYKQAQVVMMDHLAETNEGLFQFFKVRYKIPGAKKDRKGGVYEW